MIRNPFEPFLTADPFQRRICSHGLRQAVCPMVSCAVELIEVKHKAFEKKYGIQAYPPPPTPNPPPWKLPNANPQQPISPYPTQGGPVRRRDR